VLTIDQEAHGGGLLPSASGEGEEKSCESGEDGRTAHLRRARITG
jgi:hypothetical protein